ncbi:tetronasin resistance protein [Bacillaceae bacterium Marseille-Q3522]|nr:tetronasin resistance protein [Bacillaceae bacterium Marseille-Q3522]
MKNLFNKTGMMFLHTLRRDWLKLVVWGLALSFFAGGFASPLYEIYGKDPAGLAGMYETMKNPAMIALVGPTAATVQTYTVGAMYSHEMLLFTALIFAIISIMHVISRTRKEEDEGTTELIRSFQVGRLANTTAIVIEMFLLHVVIALITTGILVASDVPGMDFSSNLLYSVSLGAQGFLWAMFALICANLATSSGGARGLSFIVLGISYLARMYTDMENIDLSWLNPLGWSYLTNVYVENDWLPIIITIVVSMIMMGVAYALERHRDIDAGYLPERSRRAHAKESLLSLPGLVLRLQKNFIIGWLIAIFIGGATYGSIFGDMENFMNDNEVMRQMFLQNSEFTIQEQFMSVLFVIMALLSGIFALGSLLKLVSEERKNHWDQLYAMHQSRAKFYWLHVILASFLGLIGQFAAVVGMYVAQLGVMEDPLSFWEVTRAGMVWVPAVFFLVALLALMIGWLPRFSSIIWGYILFAFFVSYFGQLIDLPEWVKNLDVFSYIPRIPVEEMKWPNIFIIKAIALVMIVLGLIGYKRRDMISG